MATAMMMQRALKCTLQFCPPGFRSWLAWHYLYSKLSWMSSRELPLVTKHTLTQIFIKYMHDIVLQISFLDINSQNWITGSHLKLLQKSLKIQYIFQKFLCMADGPDRTDFWIQKFFCSGPFLIFLQI